MSAPKVFISYSHKDEDWKDRLCLQLDVLGMEGLLSIWDDRQIIEGDDWYPEIEAALNSCDIAVMLISAHFLTSGFIRGKEVPALLQRREQEGIRVIPVIIKPCPWQKVSWLSAIQGGVKDNVVLSGLSEHEQEDKLSHLASRVDDLVAEAKSAQPKPANSTSTPAPISEKHIQVDKLPTVAGDFVGREVELQMLDDAFSHSNTKILQFIAAGGTGKTKLLRHWLDEKQQQDKIQNRIIWSFYSQGTTDTKQVSASPLFEAGFTALGINPDQFKTDEDRADAFADAVIQYQCLLVLDGLEP